ncbi:MAG TPA: beta-ketoacyl-[acyl-carrier-protein] synthase family protein [Pirellulaceae bacterium]|nr:beta-ketoacyl-[acyl-carrier-protein] synthase family protein [Pirellulaceae bacterium]
MRRVVVTGIGVLTPIGIGRERFWDQILECASGIGEVNSFDTANYKVHRGGELRGFHAGEHVLQQNPNDMGRTSQMAVAAARLALQDADLNAAAQESDRTGVCMGTTSGEGPVVECFDDCLVAGRPENIDSRFVNTYPCHTIAAHIAREFGFGGVNMVIPAACAAGNYAIAHAYDMLRTERADVMLAGGADAFSRITYTGFARLGAISPDLCRPFDRNRRGMIPGEGASVLVLEPLDAAIKRRAPIYAEVAGYGLSCDAHHMTAAHPEGEGAARAMTQALRSSRLNYDDVSYISAHGTGTKLSDRIETKAVKRVFNGAAYKIPMSSIKSMIGHTMGAASAIEAAVCALAIDQDRVPPTANWETRDPECDLDYVTTGAREQVITVAMSNAYAFGGNNASLVLRKCVA